MCRNKEHRHNGAAGGAAEGGASVFFVSVHLSFYTMNIYGYSLYITYIFDIYIYNVIYLIIYVSLPFWSIRIFYLRGINKAKSIVSIMFYRVF